MCIIIHRDQMNLFIIRKVTRIIITSLYNGSHNMNNEYNIIK